MVDKFVSPAIVKERIVKLCDLEKLDATQNHLTRIGIIEEILVAGESKHDPTMLSGRTAQNKLLHFHPEGKKIPGGSYVKVKVNKAASHWLFGDLIEVVSVPRVSKKLIPVLAN